MKRRDFIGIAGAGSAILLGSLFFSDLFGKKSAKPEINPDFNPDVEIDLTAYQGESYIFRGNPTKVWSYRASLKRGPSDTIQTIDNSYLGPIFRFKKGDKVRVIFYNRIPQKTIVHWHGLHINELADGHPRFVIKEGEKFVYEFEIKNRAGTYWFHPHPHGKTGPQVYRGLAGLLIVSDEEEKALDLPSGEFDIPLVIQDRTFDRNNQLVYLSGGMMERMTGFLGEQILVNGHPDLKLDIENSVYRLRILNGSNSRIYKLAWEDGSPLVVIGTDGGLLDYPMEKEYVMLGPAERLDVWVDFSKYRVGDEITLKSLSFSGGNLTGRGGMMGMMGRGRRRNISDGKEMEILKFKIVKERRGEINTLPDKLSNLNFNSVDEAININNPRRFVFAMNHMRPTINGRTFQMTKVAKDEIVKLNTVEIWELVNGSGGRGRMGGGMMQMPHPVHIHGLQFQVLERTSSTTGWDTIKDGFIDNGWKDTVLLMPGMRVKVLLKFEDYKGLFLYHCHNLEHEDLGMMRNYLIKA